MQNATTPGLPLLFTLVTLVTWAGWAFALRAIYLLVKSFTGPKIMQPGIAPAVGLGLLCLGFGMYFVGADRKTFTTIPLFWPVMPWMSWIMLFLGIYLGVLLIKTLTSLGKQDRPSWQSMATVAAGIGAMSYLYKRDSSLKLEIIKGGIDFNASKFLWIILLAVATVAILAAASHYLRTRSRWQPS
jgi:hypothetical protein